MTSTDELVIGLIRTVPGLTAGEIAIGLDLPRETVAECLRELAADGLAEKRKPSWIRSGRASTWFEVERIRVTVPASQCALVLRNAPFSVFSELVGA